MAVNLIPIHPSTPLRTRKGTVSVYSEAYKGALVEPARTNKVTCRKANPVDTTRISVDSGQLTDLTLVDMSEALLRSGLSHLCTSGLVYRLDNSTNGANKYARCVGPAGNTQPHTMSAYICGTGKGGVRKSGVSGAGSVENIVLTDSFVRVSDMGNNAVAASEGCIVANPYSVVYFILPQFEEGAFATSPIALASDGSDPLTTLTRPAANLTRPTAGSVTGSGFGVYGRVRLPAGSSGQDLFACLWGTDKDSANYSHILLRPSNNRLQIQNVVGASSNGIAWFSSFTLAPNSLFEYHGLFTPIGVSLRYRVWNGSAWGSWSAWASESVNCTLSIGATFSVGSRGTTATTWCFGNYPFVLTHTLPTCQLYH